MAVDEVLLERAAEGAPPCLRFYRWSEPTLSLGYFQSVAARAEHPESRHVPLVRRSTGGGAILHHHELTYSWTCSTIHRSAAASRELYLAFHETARELLHPLGIQAELVTTPLLSVPGPEPFLCFQRRAEGDLVVGPHKILGSAQRRRQGALLQHGSLLLKTSDQAPQLAGLAALGGITTIRVHNNTFTGNETVGGEGAAIYATATNSSGLTIISNVLHSNDGSSALYTTADPLTPAVVSYNTVFGTNSGVHFAGDAGDGSGGPDPLEPTNVVRNPLLVSFSDDADPDNDDLGLQSGSPEIDDGPPQAGFDDPDGTQNDRGHTGGPAAQ